jgi:hypothetical protein
MSITAKWDNWTQTPSTSRTSPVSLLPTNFFNQLIGDPHVQFSDTGDWLIMGYGDHNFGYTGICDASYVIRRDSLGRYDIPASSVLAYPDNSPDVCDSYLGVGPGFTKTLQATSGGNYKYFAVVPAGNASLGQSWLTWAVSDTGTGNWKFPAQGGGTTTDPTLSLQLIRRPDLDATTPSGSYRFQHVALIYNKYDDYFYIVFGWYTDAAGIWTTWWRIDFDPTEQFGLKKDAQGRYDVWRRNGSSWITTNGGEIPTTDNAVLTARDPALTNNVTGAVDPIDIVQLYKQNGDFDSMLFLYQPVLGYGASPTPIAYVKGTSSLGANFNWQSPQTLLSRKEGTTDIDLALVYGSGQYVACKAPPCGPRPAPNSMAVVQSGWQADGSPQLYGFISVARPQSCQDTDGDSEQDGLGNTGLLPLTITLSSNPRVSWVSPRSGPATGNTNVTITGTGFVAGSTTVKIDGVSATNVTVTSSTSLTASTPAGVVGDADVTVSVSGKPSTTLSKAFHYDFLDVPPTGNPNYQPWVNIMLRNGVTAGCGGSNYCPAVNIPRDQMAVFLLKGKLGANYQPPAALGIFSDVPVSSAYAAFVEDAYNRGVMPSCGSGLFCPSQPVTRGDMAIFLLKMKLGAAYVPPACTGIFDDVACPSPSANWIEDLYNRGITAGCDANSYCPGNANLRREMAVFIAKSFCLS